MKIFHIIRIVEEEIDEIDEIIATIVKPMIQQEADTLMGEEISYEEIKQEKEAAAAKVETLEESLEAALEEAGSKKDSKKEGDCCIM